MRAHWGLCGCAVDADCSATEYCDTPSNMCVAKLPNGQSVPTVTGHTPTLDGTCTADAGTITCVSGACDSKDNKRGYAAGDGPCDTANAASVLQERQLVQRNAGGCGSRHCAPPPGPP